MGHHWWPWHDGCMKKYGTTEHEWGDWDWSGNSERTSEVFEIVREGVGFGLWKWWCEKYRYDSQSLMLWIRMGKGNASEVELGGGQRWSGSMEMGGLKMRWGSWIAESEWMKIADLEANQSCFYTQFLHTNDTFGMLGSEKCQVNTKIFPRTMYSIVSNKNWLNTQNKKDRIS
jgi:hypothetical protein